MRCCQSGRSRATRTIVTSGAPSDPNDLERDGEGEKTGDRVPPVLRECMPEPGAGTSENPV